MGFFSNFLDAIKLSDDSDFDDYDEYEEYVAEEQEREQKKKAKKAQKQREREQRYAVEEDEEDVYTPAPSRSANTGSATRFSDRNKAPKESYSSVAARSNANRLQNGTSMNSTAAAAQPVSQATQQKSTNNKVVPLNRNVAPSRASLMEVSVSKPNTIEDAQDISDMLMAGKPIIVNLEGLDLSMAQRIMDFVSGCVYTLDGKLLQISGYIFILSPRDVDVSGDYLALLKQDGFGVPTFNR